MALGLIALASLAPHAVAMARLPMRLAVHRSTVFAKHICAHDRNCVRYGVSSCRRQSGRVVFCRIFDARDTVAQGKYRCQRRIRVTLNPVTGRAPVTGVGPWRC